MVALAQTVLTVIALFSPFVAATKISGCDVSTAVIDLPSNQTELAVPSGEVPTYIALGIGVQNYTCSATGTFA